MQGGLVHGCAAEIVRWLAIRGRLEMGYQRAAFIGRGGLNIPAPKEAIRRRLLVRSAGR